MVTGGRPGRIIRTGRPALDGVASVNADEPPWHRRVWCRRAHDSDVAVVDPGDDSLNRYVLYHYRSDPDRNERRNVVVIAYDNEHEFLAEIERWSQLLNERQSRGEAEPVEHVFGLLKPPGATAQAARERIEWKAGRSKNARVRRRHRDQK